MTGRQGERALASWFGDTREEQYPLRLAPDRWLVTGGRGSGKTRLGAEWVNGLVRGLRPFSPGHRYEHFALVGETLSDVREVMIEGPSGILAVCRENRPRYEASRRRVVWPTGAVAHVFSSEDPESLRGPQFEAAWCDEVGCPAMDKGPNQPNVFSDPKSAEGALPYFSSGGRSDLAQQRFLMAHHRYWDPEDEDFDAAANPVSTEDGRRMVDPERMYVWAWDARPYPAFPLRSEYWSDHGNWHYGHWLNGRLGNPTAGELINAILADHGLPAADVEGADGTVHGYVIDEPDTARGALEPLTELFGLAVMETPEGLVFRGGTSAAAPIEIAEMVSDGREPVIETLRTPDHQLPAEAVLSFRDPLVEYQAISVRHTRTGAPGRSQHAIGFPGVLETGQGRALVGDWLRRVWNEREHVAFAVAQPNAEIVPGALVRLPGRGDDWLVTEIEDGLVRKVSARQVVRAAQTPWQSANPGVAANAAPLVVGQPLAVFLDLPMGAGPGAAEDQFRIAAWQKPWKSQAVFATPEDTGFAQRTTISQPADLGMLTEALPPGVVGRMDRSATITVELYGGELSSISRAQLLNGANSVAIRSTGGAWEIVQFETAEEIAPDVWRLGSLLRGQLGTDDAAAGAEAGAYLVVLDEAVQAAGLLASEAGLQLNWRVGPAGSDLSGANFSDHSETGGLRALLPLSPVHLHAKKDGGDVTLSWVRRGRIDADSWTASDIPLGEEREEYQVEIAHAGGAVVRTATTSGSSLLYDSAEIAADFGAPPEEIDVTVRQLSLAAGWGFPATRRLSLS